MYKFAWCAGTECTVQHLSVDFCLTFYDESCATVCKVRESPPSPCIVTHMQQTLKRLAPSSSHICTLNNKTNTTQWAHRTAITRADESLLTSLNLQLFVLRSQNTRNVKDSSWSHENCCWCICRVTYHSGYAAARVPAWNLDGWILFSWFSFRWELW
jgi:hypothetical protein